jgi:hypothetical protein
MLKKSISIILIVTLFSACAVKQEDSTTTKVLKHTANAPAYAVAAVGMGVQLAIIGTITGVAKLAGAKGKKEKELEAKELELKKQQENISTDKN